MHVEGKTASYRRKDGGDIDFHFCATCASVTHYVGRIADRHGRYRTAVNMRLTDPDGIAGLPIRHFDGLDTFNELPRDGRTVRDMWF
ncbi:hypothetical protein JF539_12900 [Labrenzia aggregata]|uniref:CENP-V/GFA domain-containing protein n=1 Tax=Roseibium aggregatum TaxID=187304 RepID=A0A939EDK6_9HYPH|nr:hypothetical protein [Roseibium aggregatum]